MKVTIATLFASIAAAQLHAPVGEPKGNAITRPLNEVVPACKQFTITWQPTTPNTVSVLLLKGPSNNVVKFGPALAEGIANSGSLAWTPAGDLPTTDGSPTGYGIQIIDDVTGQYQYSTQFGIAKGENCGVVSSSGYATSSGYPTATPSPSSKGGYETGNTTSVHKSTTIIYSTASHNGTTVKPTGSMTVPTSLKSSATGTATTSSGVPQQTVNAGSALQAGLGLAGAAAAAILML
jgi:hypothetical protein